MWHPDKILVTGGISLDLYLVGQEVPIEPFLYSLKGPSHDPGILWLSSSMWWWGVVKVSPFCLQIRIKIKIFNTIKYGP